MTARHTTALIAHRQFPPALEPARFKHQLALACRHPRQEAVLAAARNALRLPRSLRHECLDPLTTKIGRSGLSGHTKSVELAPRPGHRETPHRPWATRASIIRAPNPAVKYVSAMKPAATRPSRVAGCAGLQGEQPVLGFPTPPSAVRAVQCVGSNLKTARLDGVAVE